jgi:hypothetical protein
MMSFKKEMGKKIGRMNVARDKDRKKQITLNI